MDTKENRIINIDSVDPAISKKKRVTRILTIIGFLVLAAAAILFFRYKSLEEMVSIKNYSSSKVYSGELVSTTEASGTVILPVQVTITSTEKGYADKLYVNEGDKITTKDILAELDVPDLEDERDELSVSLAQAKIDLEAIQIENKFTLRDLNTKIKRCKEDIEDKTEDVSNLKTLLELKSSRENDYENALDQLEDLNNELDDMVQDLADVKITGNIAIRKQQAKIDQLNTSFNKIEEDIEDTKIKSPINGEILSINENLAIPGSSIEQADKLFIVANRNQSYIDFDVYEQYTDQLEIGDSMTVTIGSDTMKAEIVKIGKIATMDSDGLAAMVSVRAKPVTEKVLTPGASAVASIELGVESNVLMLPRGAYLTTGNQKWVYKIDGNKAYKTAVTFGTIEGTEVQILSGLKEGDNIITSSYQGFIDEDFITIQ